MWRVYYKQYEFKLQSKTDNSKMTVKVLMHSYHKIRHAVLEVKRDYPDYIPVSGELIGTIEVEGLFP